MKNLVDSRRRLPYAEAPEPGAASETVTPVAAARPAAIRPLPRLEEPASSRPAPGSAMRPVGPTLSAAAITEARNALDAAKLTGNYRYHSVGDLLRASLEAYLEGGLRLRRQGLAGPRRRQSMLMPPALLAQYQRLPNRSRGIILERALLAFLAEAFGPR